MCVDPTYMGMEVHFSRFSNSYLFLMRSNVICFFHKVLGLFLYWMDHGPNSKMCRTTNFH